MGELLMELSNAVRGHRGGPHTVEPGDGKKREISIGFYCDFNLSPNIAKIA